MIPPLEYVDGVLRINDPHACIGVAEAVLRQAKDPRLRQGMLTLAMASAQYACGVPPTWPRPGCPAALVEQLAVRTGALMLERNDEDYLAALCVYAGVLEPRHRGAVASLLWRPRAKLLDRIDGAERPLRYLVGAAVRNLEREDHQEAQARMVELHLSEMDGEDERIEGYGAAVFGGDVTYGVDVEGCLRALRATGVAKDQAIAEAIEDLLGGARVQDIGEPAYRRAVRFLRTARVKTIATSARGCIPRVAGYGVMCVPSWFRTKPGRQDSVWHRENSYMLL